MASTLSSYDANQIAKLIELLQGKWAVHILCALCDGPVRLSDLRRALPEASKKALVTRLRTLESREIVVRRDLSSSVLRVEYELSGALRLPLVLLLESMVEWGRSYYPAQEPRQVNGVTDTRVRIDGGGELVMGEATRVFQHVR